MAEPLPEFRYHPDPIATGSIVESDATCRCCVEARGYIYTGPTYGEDDLTDEVCPWCIASGEAHEEYEVEFVDSASIGGEDDWPEVSDEVIEEVAFRTPGFSAWQQERWFTHCDDAGAFLGPMGKAELQALGPKAVSAIQKSTELEGQDWQRMLNSLKRDKGPTAYVFRCLHCGQFGGYTDSL
jgi:uncharacterized protein CbrC (UPF0167 family)